MTFKDFVYERPNMEQIKETFDALIEKFNQAENVSVQIAVVKEINAIRNHIETMGQLVSVRHTIDTTD
ncbi:MAG TPA: M3 family oligoendopeptidase, partial [Fusibacter sp.]|nr:M3 family oligoendopeptidase [Fusibacter sp.]